MESSAVPVGHHHRAVQDPQDFQVPHLPFAPAVAFGPDLCLDSALQHPEYKRRLKLP